LPRSDLVAVAVGEERGTRLRRGKGRKGDVAWVRIIPLEGAGHRPVRRNMGTRPEPGGHRRYGRASLGPPSAGPGRWSPGRTGPTAGCAPGPAGRANASPIRERTDEETGRTCRLAGARPRPGPDSSSAEQRGVDDVRNHSGHQCRLFWRPGLRPGHPLPGPSASLLRRPPFGGADSRSPGRTAGRRRPSRSSRARGSRWGLPGPRSYRQGSPSH
jgi:hypothetical protein